jgi:hypothetical protein
MNDDAIAEELQRQRGNALLIKHNGKQQHE